MAAFLNRRYTDYTLFFEDLKEEVNEICKIQVSRKKDRKLEENYAKLTRQKIRL